jgi:dipeptidyl-peptidase-4
MKRILFALTIALGLNASAGISADKAMAKFVYPGNKTVSVAAPEYLADSDVMVRMSDDGKRIVSVSPSDGKELETLLDLGATRENKLDEIDGFTISMTGKQIMVWTNQEPIYRNSVKARYWVYDTHSRILRPLVDDVNARQRAPIFSPDGRMVAFASADDNNIYIKKLDYNTLVAVTEDGARNKILNGVPDWTYEEEFGVLRSMVWAPDNLTLCFLKYNETQVPLYDFPLYEGICDTNEDYSLYPGSFRYKYPVAGMKNSKVSLHAYDIETRATKTITLPDSRIEYIPRIDYAFSPDRLIVTTLNRDQNRMELYSVNPRATTSRSLFVEENAKGWIEPISYEGLVFTPDFFVVSSGRSGFTQLYQYGYSGALERTLTNGNCDVTAYYGYSTAERAHYYQCASGTINRVICRIDAKGVVKELSPSTGTADAWFSPTMKWMMMRYSNVNTPPRYTFHTSAAAPKSLRTVEDNAEVASRYSDIPRREFVKIPASGTSPELNAYIVKPTPFDASKKYPVIMYQYSGPGSQEVRDRWTVDWENYYATQGYVIVCADGRGTGYRGSEFRESVYRNLGYLETIDQLSAARYAASLPYVDPSRIGMFGWSYGGYETLMSVAAKGNPYKAAVAVAPVTDWRYYDTVYAERYMLTPAQNEAGYRSSAPVNNIADMNSRLLIMHGTADDNVHFSNTVEYISRLLAAGKFCDMFIFPNQNHSIRDCDMRLMVYSRMLDYFNQNLR